MVHLSDILFTNTCEVQLNGVTFQVHLCPDGSPSRAWRIWKLVPMRIHGALTPLQSLSETLGSGSLPSYDGDATGQSSTRAQHAESERDDFGTIVTEVTTITTRRRYRVEDS